MSANKKSGMGFLGGVGEFFRKKIVGLKRKPHIIPGIVLLFAFLYFSFNLTQVSQTTALVQGKGMGLCQFCVMLFSLLSMVCLLNAFPHRKKPNVLMVALLLGMLAILIFCDITYINRIAAALNRPENPIVLSSNTMYVASAYNMLNVHIVIVCVGAALVVLLPLYSKLIRKINTSVNVEGNGAMDEIEISE